MVLCNELFSKNNYKFSFHRMILLIIHLQCVQNIIISYSYYTYLLRLRDVKLVIHGFYAFNIIYSSFHKSKDYIIYHNQQTVASLSKKHRHDQLHGHKLNVRSYQLKQLARIQVF